MVYCTNTNTVYHLSVLIKKNENNYEEIEWTTILTVVIICLGIEQIYINFLFSCQPKCNSAHILCIATITSW